MHIMEAAPTSSDFEEASYFESEKELAKRLDWYAEYETVRPLFQRLMQYSDSILVLGPGSSGLHEQLYDSGYRGITCVDFSSKILQMWRQSSAEAGRNTLKYQLSDVTQGLSFEHYPYNVIVDKGTMDCILCRKTGLDDFGKAIQVVWNNLKKPGVFVMISHGTPDMRLSILQQAGWESIQVKVIIPPNMASLADRDSMANIREYSAQVDCPDDSSFVYICRKPY